ncbi:hypothetical protein DPMN_074955 [Dreissena polymorpha]|uniref:Vacuolar protein sorting-associated protein 16 homolog n=1 Tax=Dreissena polymorpha TaxID=45954 RepID=A0A9D4BNX6_DREPO|nr:hypothetical protein DPMN_074955 [Dreissena polymorpha]
MEQLYDQEENHQEVATCKVMGSFKQERLEDRVAVLNEAKDSFTKAKNDFAAKQVEDQMKLLRYQRLLEEELQMPCQELSLHETIHKLMVTRNHKMAEQLRKEFKVPEKRYWWLRVDALAQSADWVELDKFSKSKKPLLGMEAFVDACMKYDAKMEARKYIPRVSPEKKVYCLIKTGLLREAAEVAFENRSEEELNKVLRACSTQDRTVEDQVRAYKQQLGAAQIHVDAFAKAQQDQYMNSERQTCMRASQQPRLLSSNLDNRQFILGQQLEHARRDRGESHPQKILL